MEGLGEDLTAEGAVVRLELGLADVDVGRGLPELARVLAGDALDLDAGRPEVAEAEEVATHGVRAVLAGGDVVRVGKPAFIEEVAGSIDRPALRAGETAVYVAVGDQLAGLIIVSDPVRPHAAETITRLRAAGVAEIAMVTGDVAPTAESVAELVGIGMVHAETTPQTKVEIIRAIRPRPDSMKSIAPCIAADPVAQAFS